MPRKPAWNYGGVVLASLFLLSCTLDQRSSNDRITLAGSDAGTAVKKVAAAGDVQFIGAVKVDLMPTSEAVLGFSNRWYVEAVRSAAPLRLPSGTVVRLISAPAFLATKFEAFRTRGRADLISSHDFEDIINVVEGRPTLVEEIASAEVTLRAYLIGQFADVSAAPGFANALPGLVAYDELHGQRVAAVMKRIETIAARATNGVP